VLRNRDHDLLDYTVDRPPTSDGASSPAKLGAFSKENGALIASPDICGDADDVFVDASRRVSCGEGFIGVLDTDRTRPNR
jgi:hypothetical protein